MFYNNNFNTSKLIDIFRKFYLSNSFFNSDAFKLKPQVLFSNQKNVNIQKQFIARFSFIPKLLFFTCFFLIYFIKQTSFCPKCVKKGFLNAKPFFNIFYLCFFCFFKSGTYLFFCRDAFFAGK